MTHHSSPKTPEDLSPMISKHTSVFLDYLAGTSFFKYWTALSLYYLSIWPVFRMQYHSTLSNSDNILKKIGEFRDYLTNCCDTGPNFQFSSQLSPLPFSLSLFTSGTAAHQILNHPNGIQHYHPPNQTPNFSGHLYLPARHAKQ